jgi:uncharacterized protein YfiM (DUF2279 family)
VITVPVLLLWFLGAPGTHQPTERPAAVVFTHPVRAFAADVPRMPLQQQDAWFGEDKQRHFAMTFFVTSISHAGGRMAGMDAEPATVLGMALAAAVSVGKEVHDRRAGGLFSLKDLVWDAAGIAVGAVLVRQAR